MKRLLVVLTSMALVFGILTLSNAELIDRGGGLIYDSEFDLTWLQRANYGFESSWQLAMEWAEQLQYYDGVRDFTWIDWRLPKK